MYLLNYSLILAAQKVQHKIDEGVEPLYHSLGLKVLSPVMDKIVFLKIVFYFKIENIILFSIFKILLKSIL